MDSYIIEKHLGAGNFGSVVLVKHKRSGLLYVCKRVDLATKTPAQRKECENEVHTMSKIHHPNTVGFIEAFIENNALHIVMEYADGEDLEKTLISYVKKKEQIPENRLLGIFVQITLGLRQLHKQHLLHRDLKSANVFLTTTGGVKVGDFGFSKQLNYTMALASTVCGTPYYFSPELCQKLPYNNKSDVWALGVILYEMINLRKPFEAKTLKELRLRVVTEEPAPFTATHVSNELKELCGLLLRKSSSQRPTLDQVLAQPVIRAHLEKLTQAQAVLQQERHQRGEQIVTTEILRQTGRLQAGGVLAPHAPTSAAPTATATPGQPAQPATNAECLKTTKWDMKELKALKAQGKMDEARGETIGYGAVVSPGTSSGQSGTKGTTEQLFARPMPDARGKLGDDAPASVVTELQSTLVEEENARLLANDVSEILQSLLSVSSVTAEAAAVIGDPQDEEERKLRDVLGDARFTKAIELVLTLGECPAGTKQSDDALAALEKFLGERSYLIPELQKIAIYFVME